MSRKSEYSEIIAVLQQLNRKYPSYNMGRHICTALDEYPDTWGMTDKEFLFAINKYAAELEFNAVLDDDEFLKQVIEDGEHMFDIVDDEDEQEEY